MNKTMMSIFALAVAFGTVSVQAQQIKGDLRWRCHGIGRKGGGGTAAEGGDDQAQPGAGTGETREMGK